MRIFERKFLLYFINCRVVWKRLIEETDRKIYIFFLWIFGKKILYWRPIAIQVVITLGIFAWKSANISTFVPTGWYKLFCSCFKRFIALKNQLRRLFRRIFAYQAPFGNWGKVFHCEHFALNLQIYLIRNYWGGTD